MSKLSMMGVACVASLLAVGSADAAVLVFLCYSQNSGIVGGSSTAGFEGCSIVEGAGESIRIPEADKDKTLKPISALPLEINKSFDRASPALRQFALTGVTLSGDLVFLGQGPGGVAHPFLRIEFANATIGAISLSSSPASGAEPGNTSEILNLQPTQITWISYVNGDQVAQFSWTAGQ